MPENTGKQRKYRKGIPLCPENTGKQRKGGCMDKTILAEMSWKEAENRMKQARAVIVPLGSLEQHGYHMSLQTDNIVGEYVAGVLAKRTGCVVLPVLPYGQVWSAKDFPGTISLRERTFIEVVKDIVTSLEHKGARNVILFASHWGNTAPAKIAARELLDESGYTNVYYLSYMDLKKHGKGIMETELWNGSGFHAAEIETSIVLHIRPESVDMEKTVCEYPQVPGDVNIRPVPWITFCESGIFGDAAKATAEKGRRFLENWIEDLVQLIEANIL